MRTVHIVYAGAMFFLHFVRDGVEVHSAQRIKILPEEILNWLVAEKLP